METHQKAKSECLHYPSSYRTYEEWKQREDRFYIRRFQGSYRTYEEWKLPFNSNTREEKLSSYRTYEEWKHGF